MLSFYALLALNLYLKKAITQLRDEIETWDKHQNSSFFKVCFGTKNQQSTPTFIKPNFFVS